MFSKWVERRCRHVEQLDIEALEKSTKPGSTAVVKCDECCWCTGMINELFSFKKYLYSTKNMYFAPTLYKSVFSTWYCSCCRWTNIDGCCQAESQNGNMPHAKKTPPLYSTLACSEALGPVEGLITCLYCEGAYHLACTKVPISVIDEVKRMSCMHWSWVY